MERIETSKLNRNLKDILARVANGETLMLTRYGKDVARIGPPLTEISIRRVGARPSVPDDNVAQNARDALLNRIRGRK